MKFTSVMAEMFARVWGVKDRDFSSFLVGTAHRELTLDRNSMDRLIFVRLSEMLRYAEQTSVYYAKIFADNGVSSKHLKSIEDLRSFPCLTRDALRENLPNIISGGEVLPSWRKSATGGTTSSPVAFYCDNKALWRKNAFSRVIDGWYGRKAGDRVAYLWGAPQDLPANPTIGMRLRNITYQRTLMLPSAPLDDEILNSHYNKLVQWRPVFLQAYPTPLYELCLFLKKRDLKLPFIQGVSVTAETLFHEHRRVIEETLDLRVFNWYGSRELARVASECECHNGLHINEPCVYVEIEPDPSLPEGCGHLVVTDLLNRATPLIRYHTGDIARFVEGECSCGRPMRRIAAIEGRLADLILLPGGRKVPGVSLTNRVVKDFQEISELQIVQKTPTDFLVRFVKGQSFSPASLDVFVESFYSLLDIKVTVTFEEVAQIPRERSGKVRFVISKVS